MEPDENQDRFTGYLDQYLSYLEGSAEPPVIDHLQPDDQRQLTEMFRIVDANWASHIELPPFEEDPVARALGLVDDTEPSSVLVTGDRLKARRQGMGLSRSDLVSAVSASGWTIKSSELARLERAEADMVPGRYAAALAKALRTSVTSLGPSANDPIAEFLAWLYADEFEHEVASWSVEHRRPVGPTQHDVRTKMLAPARRSGGPGGRTQWLQTLRAILEAME